MALIALHEYELANAKAWLAVDVDRTVPEQLVALDGQVAVLRALKLESDQARTEIKDGWRTDGRTGGRTDGRTDGRIDADVQTERHVRAGGRAGGWADPSTCLST